MNAIQQLEDALQERNTKTNAFLETIISIINDSVANLPFCTRANSTPEVAGSVKVLRRNLNEIIGKIKDDRNIDTHAAEALVSRLKFTNVKRSPSGLTPRSSEVDAARFSEDGSRSSYASATGSPRSSYASATGSSSRVYPIVKPNANGEYDFNQPPRGETRRR
jgi:hypothetical protein